MFPKDKQAPLPEPVSARPQLKGPKKTALAVLVAILGLLACAWHSFDHNDHISTDDVCPQTPELVPDKNYALWESLSNIYSTNSFKLKAVDWLSGAVRVP